MTLEPNYFWKSCQKVNLNRIISNIDKQQHLLRVVTGPRDRRTAPATDDADPQTTGAAAKALEASRRFWQSGGEISSTPPHDLAEIIDTRRR